jgi:23S rRNA pseudouridine955/2504/2580 synthase
MLHSYRLEFPVLEEPFSYLSGKAYEAPLPNDFKNLLNGEKLT